MMKRWILTFLLLIVFPVLASHIVGGEFELLHISGNKYRLNMILYFDKIHGSKGALDTAVDATIWRKKDNAWMMNVHMPLTDSSDVGYTIPACSHGEIVTKKLIYTDTITLSPDRFDDPAGYYVSWQRCCRNYQINNIYSYPPPQGNPNYPYSAGQTFYLEFPAVVKDGQPFYNSSPKLFPPLNDYGCPYKPYYVDFTGVDDDGDSLVYTLVEPLNTKTDDALPTPAPGPYSPVRWQPGYSLNNIMNGHPDLRITYAGFLTATPTLQGLYVFAVKVEQYRDKKKIGESRRDFQMLVVDGCQPAQAPQIVGVDNGGTTHANFMSASFANTVPDTSRCITVRVSDPDSELPSYGYTQNLTIRAFPINFKDPNFNEILPAITHATVTHGSSYDFKLCFPPCPFIDGPFEIGVVAFDQSCALPLTDTLTVLVNIQPPPNTHPFFTTPNPVTATLNEGDSATWIFQARDAEDDNLVVNVLTDGFLLADAGMTFTITKNQPGLVEGKIHWNAYCDIYDFTKRTSFQIKVLVDDVDQCNFYEPVIATYNLNVKLPGVADPFIDTDLTPDPHEHQVSVEKNINESLNFNVTSTQADGNFIVESGAGQGFDLAAYGISFAQVSGTNLITSPFKWDLRCSNFDLTKRDTFEIKFVVFDNTNKCRIVKTDTVTVDVKVLPPVNNAPDLLIENPDHSLLGSSDAHHSELNLTLGQPIALDVVGTDVDFFPAKDSLQLQLISAVGAILPEGYTFNNAGGRGMVESPFTWNPDCSIFKDGVYQNEYTFTFGVRDDRCFNIKGDTVMLTVRIKDIDANVDAFLPYNVITPNGDGCNDYFALEGIDSEPAEGGCGPLNDADKLVSLPKDNCQGHFEFIRIFNRWGKQVFESSDRKFRWYAQNETAGVYYYFIEFGNREYKGSLSVRP